VLAAISSKPQVVVSTFAYFPVNHSTCIWYIIAKFL